MSADFVAYMSCPKCQELARVNSSDGKFFVVCTKCEYAAELKYVMMEKKNGDKQNSVQTMLEKPHEQV
jgi:DNA-directed RNA polymerase subunit M/transcription elongation factor TFIIS